MSGGREYRVVWRRGNWAATTSSKTRLFNRHADAQAFVGRLAIGRRGLASAEITVSWRPVGRWQQGWPATRFETASEAAELNGYRRSHASVPPPRRVTTSPDSRSVTR